MAYRRIKRRYPARRRPTRKSSYRFKSRRSYTARRRPYRRPVSRKRVLNMTSRKKHDTMRNHTNLTASLNGGGTYAAEQTILRGGRLYALLWCATARTTLPGTGVDDPASRTAQTCYMRGLKEKIQIQTSSGIPWQWRRICFTMKGASLLQSVDDYSKLNVLTSNGYMRETTDWNAYETQRVPLFGPLFKGQQSVDWHNFFSAKTDNDRVTIKYDVTRIIQSGNASGVMRNYNLWHPMNKNLVYGDDEAAGENISVSWSTTGKAGMGDYYVLDLIGAGTGSTSSDNLAFDPTATLYWHEK